MALPKNSHYTLAYTYAYTNELQKAKTKKDDEKKAANKYKNEKRRPKNNHANIYKHPFNVVRVSGVCLLKIFFGIHEVFLILFQAAAARTL